MRVYYVPGDVETVRVTCRVPKIPRRRILRKGGRARTLHSRKRNRLLLYDTWTKKKKKKTENPT